MAYTKFGEYMRILRIKNYEIMGDIAKILGTTTPFLSAVENGKKNVPQEWIPIIVKHYNLNQKEEMELQEAVIHSRTQIKIELKDSNEYQRDMAIQFAREIDNIDEETAKKILELLKNSGEN